MTLNPSQLQAVQHDQGPLLIVAGAGTGKTTVIAERIRYLVTTKHVDPYSIFVTTFTDKAAEELEIRLDQVMPFGYRAPWMGTFHSVCERILRQEALEIGLSPSFTIMTRTDSWILVKKHLYDFDLNYYRPLGNPTKFIDALLTFFSRLSDEDVDLAEFAALVNRKLDSAATPEEIAESHRLKELLNAYSTYQLIKQNEKKMDFSDLISHNLHLFRTRPNVLSRYQHQFQYLLIDEFQDTNIAQFELIKLLAPPQHHPNLMVVGDDNQSIYKFRSASVSNILQFKDLYKDAVSVVLTDNYRSTQPILDGAYRSISANNPNTLEFKLGISKQLISHLQVDSSPTIYQFANYIDEINWIIAEIQHLVSSQNLNYKDIAILARANSHLDPLIPALNQANIPFQRVTNGGLYEQPLIKNLIIFLKVLLDPQDSLTLFSLISSDLFPHKSTNLLDHLITAKNNNLSLWDYLQTQPDWQAFVQLIHQYRDLSPTLPVSQLLRQFIDQQHIVAQLVAHESIDNQLSLKNLNLFFNLLKQFELNNSQVSLPFFMETFEAWEEAGDNPGQAQLEDVDVVSLSTVHKAKGLEYEAVFVINLVAGRFPSNDRKDKILVPDELVKETLNTGDEHLQEERRLFYVALTRAKRYLYLTFSTDLGGPKKWKPSGFLAETGFPLIHSPSPSPSSPSTPKSIAQPRRLRPIINKLSFSKIDAFNICPLRFKYAYLDHVPTTPSHQAQYGSAVHQVLYHLHMAQKTGHTVDFDNLMHQLQTAIVQLNIPLAQKQQYQATAATAFTRYFQIYTQQFGTPLMLEEPFTLKLGNGAIISGKIDRIDQLPDNRLILIDYKTGEVSDQKSVDKNEQLTLYALAARRVFGFEFDSLYLYFFNANQYLSTSRTSKKLDNYQQRLQQTWEEIQVSHFPPNPSEHNCQFCEFRKICPHAVSKKQAS